MLDLLSPERFGPHPLDPRRRRSARILALGLLLGAIAAALWPTPSRADFLDDAWGRFERSLAVFDPAGQTVALLERLDVPLRQVSSLDSLPADAKVLPSGNVTALACTTALP